MSQPLFNHLRTSTMLGNHQGALPTGVLGFPSSNSALGALGSGGFNQSPGNVRLNHNGGGTQVSQQVADFPKKSGLTYNSDTDRRLQYEVPGAKDGLFSASNNQAKHLNNVGFKQDFYGQDFTGPQTGFRVGEQNTNLYNSVAQAEQWKEPAQSGAMDMVPEAASVWKAAGQSLRPRADLYNPEEPTSDLKFNPKSGVPSFSSISRPGFSSYQPIHGGEETMCSGSKTLLPHQVNDYHAVIPTQLPHQCSICDKKVYNLKDWDQHVKGKLHLQNQLLYTSESSSVSSAGATHFTVGRTSDVSHCTGGTNSMIYSAASQVTLSSQDASSGANAAYLPASAMNTYPLSNTGFAAHQPESKAFPPRKATAGRVVHICNLPEGSCTENDVINLGLPFGKVTKYILMRSTHQAFLELSYVEAAQAMVQYYQLTPAMINNQKLLIRMSKRYKELQLKKPGKDVQTIIQDIASQRDREEMQELEHYMPERARSRSPVCRSLSPHSHSPSFTSCNSVHSPQGVPPRVQERCSNGTGPSRNSWDRSVHMRRADEDKERVEPWRNGSGVDDDRPNGRASERRKAYSEFTRAADERGGDDGVRGNRDWYPRSSPQDYSYRRMDDGFPLKEPMYKSDKPSRQSYQRHDSKSRRKDDHHSSRSRQFETTDENLGLSPEEKNSPSRSRSKRSGRKLSPSEKHDTGKNDRQTKEKSTSPHKNNKISGMSDSAKQKVVEKEQDSGENTDEECWYPKNMEELVTVDEVGGEEDSIIEPDLPELDELACCPKESAEENVVTEPSIPPTSNSEMQDVSSQKLDTEEPCVDSPNQTDIPENVVGVLSEATCAEEKVIHEPSNTNLSNFPGDEFKTALEETCLSDKVTDCESLEETTEILSAPEDIKTPIAEQVTEPVPNGTQHKELVITQDIEAHTSSNEQDKAVSELSIPLGVEFVVPSSGYYCKLCGLFYTSEETAKSAHCRSTIHYMNLQKYLSQLAQQSLMMELSKPAVTQ
ncbi:RNA-binding protein 20 isoform 1-T2 [Synchiropus picturatus]